MSTENKLTPFQKMLKKSFLTTLTVLKLLEFLFPLGMAYVFGAVFAPYSFYFVIPLVGLWLVTLVTWQLFDLSLPNCLTYFVCSYVGYMYEDFYIGYGVILAVLFLRSYPLWLAILEAFRYCWKLFLKNVFGKVSDEELNKGFNVTN